ncbi:MAG: shikimate dehydrogenase [Dehalococcoidia bacterium]|nr:shikimate dehydrogenase [Dehalococcoidia bacterium]
MTATIALIGHPVAHSISPRFQQAALDAAGVDAHYEAWDTTPEALPAAIERLRSGDVLGANVTVPHKVAALRLIERPDPLAELVGAVNTIWRERGLLHATNTDVAGVLHALADAGVTLAGEHVVLLGAGGAARAVVVALRRAGAASLTIANRTLPRAQALAELAGQGLPASVCELDPGSDALRGALMRAGLVIHSTPLGMRHGPDERATPLPADCFHRGQVAFDLVYVPERTPFLDATASAGARTVGGLAMLVHQGAESFRLWTGREPSLEVMFAAARAALDGAR